MARVALLLLPVLAVAVSACGGSTLDPVANAATKSADQGTEHVTIQGTVAAKGQSFELTGEGDADNDKRVMSMHVSASGLAMDEVMNGWVIYMRSPLFASGLPAGKTWLKLDLEKAGKAVGIDFNAFSSYNPASTLDALKTAGHVEKVGEEEIDGAHTTHYTAQVDPAKVPNGAKVQQLTNAKYGPTDVWVDDDGLVRRLRTDTTASGTHSVMTMSFSDYGKTVDVQVPDDSQVMDATQLAATGLKQKANGG
jgi:hypothetical protein